MLNFNDVLAIVIIIGVFTDFYLKNKAKTKYEIAFTFLRLSHWLRNNSWNNIQTKVVQKIVFIYEKVFGKKIFSVRFFISSIFLSMFLTSIAILLALFFIQEKELISAGFKDTSTPYFEKLQQFFIETNKKKNVLIPFYVINIWFDMLTITISYKIIKVISKSNNIFKTITLSLLDYFISMFVIQAIIFITITISFIENLIIPESTTALIDQDTLLFFTASTVALPIITFSLLLVFIALVRLIIRIFDAFFSRFADESKTVFSQIGTLASATIKFISVFPKIYYLFILLASYIFNVIYNWVL